MTGDLCPVMIGGRSVTSSCPLGDWPVATYPVAGCPVPGGWWPVDLYSRGDTNPWSCHLYGSSPWQPGHVG